MSETTASPSAEESACPGLKGVRESDIGFLMQLNFDFEWIDMAPSPIYFYLDGRPPMTPTTRTAIETAALQKYAAAFPTEAKRVYAVHYQGFFPMSLTPDEMTAEAWRMLAAS